MLRLVGALEDASEHPIARAIARAARERAGAAARRRGLRQPRGPRRRGRRRRPRRRRRPPRAAGRLGDAPAARARGGRGARPSAQGRTAIAAGWDGAARALLVVADTVKPTSAEAVARLKALGLRPVLLTGDNEATARAVAAEVGIERGDRRGAARRQGRRRPPPAGARAASSRWSATASTTRRRSRRPTSAWRSAPAPTSRSRRPTSRSSRGDLRAAADAIRLSRATLRTIKQNLGWAFGYNVAALPLAAAGLLNPLLAGAAMAFSSVSVVANALRLRRFR